MENKLFTTLLTVETKDGTSSAMFDSVTSAMLEYQRALNDPRVIMASLTSGLASQPIAQVEKDRAVNGIVYNILG